MKHRRSLFIMSFAALLTLTAFGMSYCRGPEAGASGMTTNFSAPAADSKVAFQSITFQEAKNKAASENKVIFLDAYTTWCGPCKRMDRDVFTDAAVAEYFNEHFINLHVDMEKGEGIELSKKYDVQFYPTLLFLNPKGEIIKKEIGYKNAAQLITVAKSLEKSSG